MKLVTSEEMQKIDKHTIETIGIPSLVLMEKAGYKVFELIRKKFKNYKNKIFTIVCGKGNNGGDGLVVARNLATQNTKTNVFITHSYDCLSRDAKANLDILQNLGISIKFLNSNDNINEFENTVCDSDYIIDAIFGTGFNGDVVDPIKTIIDIINKANKTTVSVDVPSGVCATTGNIASSTVKADITVTFALPKVGMYLYPAHEYTGEIWVADIGIPSISQNTINSSYYLITTEFVKNLIPQRSDYHHKGNFGDLIVLAGSLEYQGAGVLSALGGLKSGVGKVTLGFPKGVCNNLKIPIAPEIIIKPYSDEKGYFALSLEEINQINTFDGIVLGPGWGRNEILQKSLKNIIKNTNKPLLIDADGINVLTDLISNNSLEELSLSDRVVLTPHVGELARLASFNSKDIKSSFDLIKIGKELVRKLKCFLVIKSSISFIITPDLTTYILCMPNSALAKGGSGDLLAGIIGGFMSQGVSILNSCILGVFIHSSAGKLAIKNNSSFSITISEISNYINKWQKFLFSSKLENIYKLYKTI